MRVMYITYEDVYATSILQAMVIVPLGLMQKKYDIDYCITSSKKKYGDPTLYQKNKTYVCDRYPSLKIKEFSKKMDKKQSIMVFLRDIYPMILFVIKQVKKYDVMHCRSYGGAVIGLIAYTVTRKPYIFDMRGLLPEETVDIGKLKEKSWRYKLLKWTEKILVKKAGYVLTVSDRFSKYIEKEYQHPKIMNLSNPTNFANYYTGYKQQGKINFIYSGSLQKWHLPEVTLRYFKQLYQKYGEKVYLYFCTNDKKAATSMVEKMRLPEGSFEINKVAYDQMKDYYAKADIAFCLIEQTFSKSVCFPVKFSEYIAANLFVLTNRGIGDLSDIVEEYSCGYAFQKPEAIEENFDSICEVVDNLLVKNCRLYNRNDLNFLDWEANSLDMLYAIYSDLSGIN